MPITLEKLSSLFSFFFELLNPYRMDQIKRNYYKRLSKSLGLQGFQLGLEFLHFSFDFARVSPCFVTDLLKTSKEKY